MGADDQGIDQIDDHLGLCFGNVLIFYNGAFETYSFADCTVRNDADIGGLSQEIHQTIT